MKNKKILVVILSLILMGNFSHGEKLYTNRQAMEKVYRLGEDKNKPIIKTEYEFLRPGFKVVEKDSTYIWAIGGENQNNFNKILYKSDDLGRSFEKVYDFNRLIEGVHISRDGIILVCLSEGRWKDESKSEILISGDRGKNFKKVLDIKSGAAINWSFDSDEFGAIFISEYGYKFGANNARRIYRSLDKGESFQLIYNPKEEYGQHNHRLQIDRENPNIIYQVVGDENKKILRSRDRGKSWEVIVRGYHPTAILQIDEYILFGLDNYPISGILRYGKKDGKLDYSFKTPKPYSGSNYDMIYENGIIYAGFLSYSSHNNYWPGSMFISKDKGKTWEIFMSWPKLNENSGIGFYNILAKDGYGFIEGVFPMYVNGKPGMYSGSLKFKLLN